MPIEKIEFSDVDGFCRSGVREGILLDFTKDFPTRLDKAIAAFANTYGGIILIGVDESATGEPVLPICGVPLVSGLRERVIQVGLDAIYPPLIPEVKVVEFKRSAASNTNDRAFVVIRVHESDVGSHAVDNRTTVYLRAANVSDLYRKASVEEIEWFANKREKAVREKARIIELAQMHAQQYLSRLRNRRHLPTSYPRAHFAFWTVPSFPRVPVGIPQRLLQVCPRIAFDLPSHSHRFPLGLPHPITEGIYFDGDYYDAYRYTEIQQQGLAYHEYGFWWDAEHPDKVFPNAVAELLLAGLQFGIRVYETVGYWGLTDYEFRLVGVRDRRMYSPQSFLVSEYTAVDDVVAVRTRTSVSSVREDAIEPAKSLFEEILWAFGWAADSGLVDRYFQGLKF